MPRASRYFLPGCVWHLTHRCHRKEYLLKFSRDRRRWIAWLYEARKRYGLSVLNYMVTSNHVHLLVYAGEDRLSIPRSMQLIAGRVGQEFNLRKNRSGAFWEDRYHATAVETGEHLARCLVYIDLNMVRAGSVSHPEEWKFCGYQEIQHPSERYRIIDQSLLARLLDLNANEELSRWEKEKNEETLASDNGMHRCPDFTENIAVGSARFVEKMQRRIIRKGDFPEPAVCPDNTALREKEISYRPDFTPENELLRGKNTVFWKLNN